MKRREFIKLTAAAFAAPYFFSKNLWAEGRANRKVLVLGIDGLAPDTAFRMAMNGELPNIKKFLESGYLHKMNTTPPPQSPVAWSNFTTGNNPGKHGIYDFIHRYPETYTPYLSTSEKEPGGLYIKFGTWKIPLIPSRIVNARKGKPFWSYLEENNIPSFIIKIPSNFPPSGNTVRSLSGLGTPDIKGTNGEFSLYTNIEKVLSKDIEGGKIYPVSVVDGYVLIRAKAEKNQLDIKILGFSDSNHPAQKYSESFPVSSFKKLIK